jgi:hypothetical protein
MYACMALIIFRLLTCMTILTYTYIHTHHNKRLEFVHGYDAHATSNVCILKSGEILYSVAALCVILNLSAGRRTQRIFTKHTRKCRTCVYVYIYIYIYIYIFIH